MKEPSNLRGYRLERPLGTGGMGSVWIGEKIATHQKFAIKFLKEEYLEDQTYVTRFEREVAALRAIRHPHVVNIFDWSVPRGDPEAKPYVVMELLEGEGLDRLLRRMRVLPPALAVNIMLQMLDGLAAAHAVGVIHRDLGPSNVHLVPQPGGKLLAKVLDFGLAKPMVSPDESQANTTQKGTLMGKPAYIAPEMFLHQPLDARSDIYACGMILFRMLAGRLPYKESQAQMLWMERYGERQNPVERPSVRSFAPSIPEKLSNCVARMIRLRPEERYQSAEDVQIDLLEIEDSVLDRSNSSVMPPPARPEEGTPTVAAAPPYDLPVDLAPSRRRLGLAAAAGGGLLALAAVLWATGLFGGGEDAEDGNRPAGRAGGDVAVDVGAGAQRPLEGDVAGAAEPAAKVEPGPGEPATHPSPTARIEIAAPRTVLVVVVGAPEGAGVSIGETRLGGSPPQARIAWSDRVAEVVVEADGFEPFRKPFLPTEDRVIEVEMRPVRRVGRPPGPGTPGRPPRDPRPGPPTKGLPAFVEDLPL